jgi:3-deoxy-D-manno-octulosonic-acid transferase
MKRVTLELSLKIIIDIFYFICLPWIIFFYLLKRKYHSGWIERIGLGRWRKILKESRQIIWIHAVSVGEARLAGALYEVLKPKYPNLPFLLTSITQTGQRILSFFVRAGDYLAFLPLDFSFLIRFIISRLNLRGLLILETEIWPNLVLEVKKRNIPLGLINARISKRAFPRYKLIKPLMGYLLDKFDFLCLSGKLAEERFRELGAPLNKSYLLGPLKFDMDTSKVKSDRRIEELREFIKRKDATFFIAGSTHPGEEEILLNSYLQMKTKFPQLQMLIAPRHFAHLPKFIKYAEGKGVKVELFSKGFKFSPNAIFIMDEVGYLPSLYEMADISFIGGSLVPRGGHNLIEAAIFGKPVIMGPYYENFEEIVWEFLKTEALFVVRNEGELKDVLDLLIRDDKLREEVGRRAKEVVVRNKGNLEKTVEIIQKYIR